MDVGDFVLRDIILVVAALAGIYFVVMLLRLYQVARHKRHAEMHMPLVDPSVPPQSDDEEDAEEPVLYAPPPRVAPAPPPPPQQDFNAELQRSQMETEIRQLREEVLALREEIVELKTARRVSPQYADAMALAQRGLTAQDLADRCDISIGEAELVAALARGTHTFEEEDPYGGARTRTA
ncbi:hypothetical protein RHDC4_00323 [Rhodocyclaceae bacterium]|nr:hypothetical protein RHDC4_00323 [Rhodocyclaceae bacterium]